MRGGALNNGRNGWHEKEATTLLEETKYLVHALTKGVPFPDRERHHREIVRAHAVRDWDAYADALAAYTAGARWALAESRENSFF